MAIKVDDYVIYTPVIDILNMIKFQLEERGVYRFNRIKQTGKNVMTNCPFHSEGQERKPSFGISENGECHCFACGWATKNFAEFVSEVFGHEDGGVWGSDWILSKIASSVVQKPRKIELPTLCRYSKAVSKHVISEDELDSYRYIHPYMYQRHLDDRIIEMFDVGYDKTRNCLTFPVKDLDGDVVFVATRSVTSKFFTLPEGEDKPVYAADIIKRGNYNYAVIAESILNALVCWKYNIPAVALFGTGSYEQIKILRRLPVRKYILALDADEAGRKGIDRIKRMLSGSQILFQYDIPQGKDLNDLDGEILNLNYHVI